MYTYEDGLFIVLGFWCRLRGQIMLMTSEPAQYKDAVLAVYSLIFIMKIP